MSVDRLRKRTDIITIPEFSRDIAAGHLILPVTDHVSIRASDLPLFPGAAALALIRRTIGPAYRPVGAAMVIGRDGSVAGNLSSGCIDADITLQAQRVIASGRAIDLRYGSGSPFPDLELPCGGGLDVRVIPLAGSPVPQALLRRLTERQTFDLWIGYGQIAMAPFYGVDLHLQVHPDIRFLIFGKGPEAVAFARMTAGAGYETFLSSPDEETFFQACTGKPPGAIRPLTFPRVGSFAPLPADQHTAVVLFFHDHDLEPEILTRALRTGAFYIGAQGSRSTASRRRQRLIEAGAGVDQLQRIHGPIGVIPSTRDARTLAASVLSEILASSLSPG